MKPKISVCIISKNEENYIESCIKSVLPIAYEIIVLDTGSTDSTLDICRGFNSPFNKGLKPLAPPLSPSDAGKRRLEEISPLPLDVSLREGGQGDGLERIKIFQTTWDNDFSKARNECISHATGEWILSIDADEVLTEDTQKQLLPFLKEQNYNEIPAIFNFKIIDPQKNDKNPAITFMRSSLFKNGFKIRFVKPLHEQLENNDFKIISQDCPFFTIYHNGNMRPAEELARKLENYITRLKKLIEETKDSKDSFYYVFYLANSYSEKKYYREAIELYQKVLTLYSQANLSMNTSFYGNILRNISLALVHTERYKEAKDYINILLKLSPDFPDALYFLGVCDENLGNFEKAIQNFEKALAILKSELNTNPKGFISFNESLNVMILYELSRCFTCKNKDIEALNILNSIHSNNPEDVKILVQLIKFHLLDEDFGKAISYYFLQNPELPDNEKEFLKMISNFPKEDFRYKQNIIRFLHGLSSLDGWLVEEKMAIMEKIKTLS